MRTYLAWLLVAAGCVACGDNGQQPAERETVFDPTVKALDRAREVDDISRARVDELDRQIEAADGTGDPPQAP